MGGLPPHIDPRWIQSARTLDCMLELNSALSVRRAMSIVCGRYVSENLLLARPVGLAYELTIFNGSSVPMYERFKLVAD